MIRLILNFRPIEFMFIKNWYSLYRWRNPFTHFNNETVKLIDIGSLTIGYGKKG